MANQAVENVWGNDKGRESTANDDFQEHAAFLLFYSYFSYSSQKLKKYIWILILSKNKNKNKKKNKTHHFFFYFLKNNLSEKNICS